MPSPDPGDWTGLVVLAAGVPWDGPWMSEKRMALALCRHVPVLYVDPARSVLRPGRPGPRRAAAPHVEIIRPGLARITPWAPPGVSRPGLRRIAIAAVRRAIRRGVAQLGAPADAVVAASFDDVLGATPARVRVLWGTDDWVAGAGLMGLSPEWLQRQEALQLRRADRVFAVSELLAARWSSRADDVEILPNGCDVETFATTQRVTPSPDVRLQPPIAGFVGHLSDRIDLDLLEGVADRGHSLLLVGPVQRSFDTARWRALIARPNVQWTGPRPAEDLPAYLNHVRVGLTPYADTPFNRSSFPLKTLEYLAAGLPVVSTDLPAARSLPHGLIELAGGPEEFYAAVERALVDDGSAAAARRLEYARGQSWDARAAQLVGALQLRGDRPGRGPR